MKKELEQRKKSYYIKNYIGLLNDRKLALINIEQRLTRELKRIVEKNREQFEFRKKRLLKVDIHKFMEIQKEFLKLKEKELDERMKVRITLLRKELEYRNIKLSRYSVNDILKQGYTITRKNGKIVRRGIELSKMDNLEIQFSDMKIKTVVK